MFQKKMKQVTYSKLRTVEAFKKKKLARNFILFYMLRIRSIYAFSLIFYSHLLHKTGKNSILFTKESPISPPK